MRKLFTIISLFIIVVSLSNCRKDYAPTGPDYTDYGWTFYEDGNHEDARTWFRESLDTDSSYADGYNGLGWALGYMDSMGTAFEIFGLGIAIGDSTDCYPDLLAGYVFSGHAIAEYDSVAALADEFIEHGSNWVFAQDESVNYQDVMILISASCFSIADYEKSLELVQILETDFTADIETSGGKSELSLKIEELSIKYL